MVQPPRFRRDRPEVTTVTSTETREQQEDDAQTRESSSSSKQRGEYGVEMVLSGTTTDTQRAKDMILPGSLGGRKKKSSSTSPYLYVSTLRNDSDRPTASSSSSKKNKQQESSNGSIGSFSTKSSRQDQSFHNGSSVSVASSTNNHRQQPESNSKSLLDDVSESSSSSGIFKNSLPKGEDTIWRAAKRGDLTTLKRFHSQGNIDWAAPDEYGKIPLYYACHSGAIVDINVVHFLLWVTPIKSAGGLDKCKNKKNKAVMKILDDFERRGYKAPMQFEFRGESTYKSLLKRDTRPQKKKHEVSGSRK